MAARNSVSSSKAAERSPGSPVKGAPRRPLVLAVLLVLLLGLQGRLWFGEGSLRHVQALDTQVEEVTQQNDALRQRNDLLAADVQDLKDGLDTLEEIARKDLGMIREGETFFIFAPPGEPLDAAAR